MAQTTSPVTAPVPIRRIPKQPECNIGTSGHVDHGKCQRLDQYVLLDGIPVTGEDILRAVRTTGELLTKVDGGEVYRFKANGVISVNSKFEPVRTESMFYVENYSGPMYAVSGRSGRSLTVTPEHPLLINRRGVVLWVKAKDILPGDYASFLSRVPLDESLSLPDPMPELRKRYSVVTWEDYEQLRSSTSGFSDFTGLAITQFEKMRLISGLSRNRVSSLAGITHDSYVRIVRDAKVPAATVREKIVALFRSAQGYRLRQGEFLLEQNSGRRRPIRKLKQIGEADSDITKWFAFVWAEGTSGPTSISITQTVQQEMRRDFLRITEDRLGQHAKSYSGGRSRSTTRPSSITCASGSASVQEMSQFAE